MKLKIIHADSNSENESEYETAVDMSHSSVYTANYRLQTLSGMELTLSYTNIETSYSYYQEDIPDDFKAGDQVRYTHHSEPDKHESNEYGHMEAILNEKVVVLTKEEFTKYFNEYLEKNDNDKYNDAYNEESPDYELNKKFYQFEQQQLGYKDYDNVVQIGSKDDVVAILSKISDKKENVWFDIELPEGLKAEIENLEKTNEAINAYNSSSRIDNMCTQASAKLNILVDKLTEEAKVSLGLAHRQSKLKM